MDLKSYADLDQDPDTNFLTKNLERMRNEGEILVFYNRFILPDPNMHSISYADSDQDPDMNFCQIDTKKD